MITLFIGRFQPFHIGHLKDIKDSLKFSEKLIIGIGSSQDSNTKVNPFSFDERKDMIEKSLNKEKIANYDIIAIPDIHNEERWAEYVISVIGKFDIVYTGNDLVARLFKEKGYKVREVQMLEGINATIIRDLMDKSQKWQTLVPAEVANYINKIDGINRIRLLDGKL